MYNFLRWCPGALGFLLRQKIYPHLFYHCGKGVLFGRYIDFKRPKSISIGNNVVFGDYVTLDASRSITDGGGIFIDDGVFVGMGTVLQVAPAPITIQADASLSSHCKVMSKQPVNIGRQVLIAAYSTIGAPPVSKEIISQKNTEINSGCWIGARATVNHGVSIGKGSIVGAHGLVETDLAVNVVAVGQPVRVIFERRASDNQSA